ncbi:MAG: hypothetical protein ACYTFY_15265, partial [Planctomycetota bacterium]
MAKKKVSRKKSILKVGISKAIINPPMGTNIVGYFNKRIVKGVLDDLYLRVILFQTGGEICGLLGFDLVGIPNDLDKALRDKLSAAGIGFTDNLTFSSIHTHTGPSAGRLLGKSDDAEYVECLCEQTVLAVKEAEKNLIDSELLSCSVQNNPYAFNRRYWLKDGKVYTNPGKLNPNIVKPEGLVDKEIGICMILQYDEPAAIIANITNHTDTMGGEMVSADWPGFMERYIQDALGKKLPVLTLVGPQGNINHFDVTSEDPQTSYAEAERIGNGYGDIILSNFDKLEPVKKPAVRAANVKINIPYRKVPEKDITSEDIIKGSDVIKKVFAMKLLDFLKYKGGDSRDFTLRGIALSNDLAIAA